MEQNQLHEYVSCSIEKWASFHTHHFKTCRTWNESLPMFIKQLVSVIVLSNFLYFTSHRRPQINLKSFNLQWHKDEIYCPHIHVTCFDLNANSVWPFMNNKSFFDDGILLTYVVSSHFQVIKFLFQCQI